MKKIISILAIIGAFTFSSCESEVSFLELAGQQGFVFTGSTEDIQTYIGQEAYRKLTIDLAVPLNTGDTPPIINGNYILWLREIIANIENPTEIGVLDTDFMHISLANQNNEDLTIEYTGYFAEVGADETPRTADDNFYLTESGIGQSFVSGTANGDFTIFTRSQVNAERVDVIAISGTLLVSGDIENLTYGYVRFDNGDPDTGTIDYGINWTDEDGFSEFFIYP